MTANTRDPRRRPLCNAEPPPDTAAAAVLATFEELLPTLRERAKDTEDARRIPAKSIEAL